MEGVGAQSGHGPSLEGRKKLMAHCTDMSKKSNGRLRDCIVPYNAGSRNLSFDFFSISARIACSLARRHAFRKERCCSAGAVEPDGTSTTDALLGILILI